MSQNIDLKKIERKAYLTYHQDGLWDIFLGIAFFGFATAIINDQAAIMAVLPVLLISCAAGIRKKFTLPRVGYAKFSAQREARKKRGLSRLIATLTITFFMGLVAFWAFSGESDIQNFIRSLGLIPFGIALMLVIGAVGILYDIKRFIVYAVLIIIFFISGHVLRSDPQAYFLLLGIIFLTVGLIMLIRFMRKYPRPANDWIYNDNQ